MSLRGDPGSLTYESGSQRHTIHKLASETLEKNINRVFVICIEKELKLLLSVLKTWIQMSGLRFIVDLSRFP